MRKLLRLRALLAAHWHGRMRAIRSEPGERLPTVVRDDGLVKILAAGKIPRPGDELAVTIDGRLDVVRVLRSRVSLTDPGIWWAECWPLNWGFFAGAENDLRFKRFGDSFRDAAIGVLLGDQEQGFIPWAAWDEARETIKIDFEPSHEGLWVRRVAKKADERVPQTI